MDTEEVVQPWLVWLSGLGVILQTTEVTGSIPGQSTYLGWGPGPQLGVWERQLIDVSLPHQCFSPFPSPSLPLSPKINKIFSKKRSGAYIYTREYYSAMKWVKLVSGVAGAGHCWHPVGRGRGAATLPGMRKWEVPRQRATRLKTSTQPGPLGTRGPAFGKMVGVSPNQPFLTRDEIYDPNFFSLEI